MYVRGQGRSDLGTQGQPLQGPAWLAQFPHASSSQDQALFASQGVGAATQGPEVQVVPNSRPFSTVVQSPIQT